MALAHTSVRDVIDKQHYSVDMFLAVVVTYAVWNALDWVYPASQPLPARLPGTPPDKLHPAILALLAGILLVAAIIVIGGHC
jgi:DNA mismatch repair protein MutS2